MLPGRSVQLSGVARDSFGSAPQAFLAEGFLAPDAHTGHEHRRMGRKNWLGLAIDAEIANGNEGVKAREETADTIRIAMQPPI